MKLHITPETRIIEIPDETTAEYLAKWLSKTGLKLFEKDGKVWATPRYKHNRMRMGDILAAFQEHPELYGHWDKTNNYDFRTVAEDSDYIYNLKVISK